ncbi:MAG: ABC transporter permease [Fibromonadaceae bacterium]|jgi:NitT/TauT family transport system permease protein|nr:ABC transporter permease [Fibromonadaceae bacterium]
MKKIKNLLYQIIPLVAFLSLWELFTMNSPRNTFLFSRPSKVIAKLIEKISDGELIHHFGVTAFEAFAGLVLGVLVGSIIGFLLLYFPKVSKISKYYVIALSSIPIFAIAPMMIIWFGIGIKMKVAMAFFSTVFVAIFQAYQGGQNINKRDAEFFKLNGASDKQRFWKLTFPSSIDWLIQSLKLNSGLAVLGAFIGEFIASDKGLGFIIIRASGLYDVSYVLAATICIIILTLIFNLGATFIEKNKLKIIRRISV